MAKKKIISANAFANEFDYNDEKLTAKGFLERLDAAFDEQAYWKRAYFWCGYNGNAATRAARDRHDSHVDVFQYNGHEYEYEVKVSRSSRNVYVTANRFTMDWGGTIREWKRVYDEVYAAHPELYPDCMWTQADLNPGKILWNAAFDRAQAICNTNDAVAKLGSMFSDEFSAKYRTNEMFPDISYERSAGYGDALALTARMFFIDELEKAGIMADFRNGTVLEISSTGDVGKDSLGKVLRAGADAAVATAEPILDKWIGRQSNVTAGNTAALVTEATARL